MIPVLIRDLRGRIVFLIIVGAILVWQEWETHQHAVASTVELGPLGLSAPMSYLAGFATIVLLAGFISTDRREGFTRLYFSHPTSPLAFYALRWGLSLAVAMAFAVVFLFVFQLVAWGEFRGGGSGIALALANTLIYGGLMAFLSTAFRRGDAPVALFLFFSTLFPQPLNALLSIFGPGFRQFLLFVLPPHNTTLQQLYLSILDGGLAWDALLFCAGYGLVWLTLSGIILSAREWP